MSCGSVFADELPVLDDEFFTETLFKEWYNTLLIFSGETINELRERTGNISDIVYEINTVLLKEVVYDAMIGLKTIVISENNEVKKPNPFKIAAYLGYWFLRHKPIIFRVKTDIDIDNIVFPSDLSLQQKRNVISDMKHLNEVTVTNFLLSYIFDIGQKPVCKTLCLRAVKSKGNFGFTNFEEMLEVIYKKLRYYLTYRTITPKTIEHFLEAYTLHPYLPYTCDLWKTEE